MSAENNCNFLNVLQPTQKEAYFGVYSCSHCEYTWKSINSFVNEGQTCYKCKFVVMATEQVKLILSNFSS